MWDITTPSEEAAAVDAARGRAAESVAAAGGSTTTATEAAVAVAEPPTASPAGAPPASTAGAPPVTPPMARPAAAAASAAGSPATQSDGVGALIALLEQLRHAPPATEIQPGMTPMQQMAVLQASTAMHLLHAGANMLLMQTGMLAAAAPAYAPVSDGCPRCFPVDEEPHERPGLR